MFQDPTSKSHFNLQTCHENLTTHIEWNALDATLPRLRKLVGGPQSNNNNNNSTVPPTVYMKIMKAAESIGCVLAYYTVETLLVGIFFHRWPLSESQKHGLIRVL